MRCAISGAGLTLSRLKGIASPVGEIFRKKTGGGYFRASPPSSAPHGGTAALNGSPLHSGHALPSPFSSLLPTSGSRTAESPRGARPRAPATHYPLHSSPYSLLLGPARRNRRAGRAHARHPRTTLFSLLPTLYSASYKVEKPTQQKEYYVQREDDICGDADWPVCVDPALAHLAVGDYRQNQAQAAAAEDCNHQPTNSQDFTIIGRRSVATIERPVAGDTRQWGYRELLVARGTGAFHPSPCLLDLEKLLAMGTFDGVWHLSGVCGVELWIAGEGDVGIRA